MKIQEAMAKATPKLVLGKNRAMIKCGMGNIAKMQHYDKYIPGSRDETAALMVHWYEHGPKLLTALQRCADRLYRLEHGQAAHKAELIIFAATEVEGL